MYIFVYSKDSFYLSYMYIMQFLIRVLFPNKIQLKWKLLNDRDAASIRLNQYGNKKKTNPWLF